MKQRGFTLILVMTVLMVLSLIVIAGFEQAQWVKRSEYGVWQSVKMQDRLWQQLTLAESQLPQRELTGQCFAPYSLSNTYFFMTNTPWPTTACVETKTDESLSMLYEPLLSEPCAKIKGSARIGVDFFRITIRDQSQTSPQKRVLQAVTAMPFLDNKSTEKPRKGPNCAEYSFYKAGEQSWLLQ